MVLSIPATVPVKVGLANGALVPIVLATIVAKFGSLPNAAANSFNVSKVAGALATKLATFVSTYVVAALLSKTVCNPDVLAIVKDPSVIVFCLDAKAVLTSVWFALPDQAVVNEFPSPNK
jgi:hypothetical protein